jgi:hypothetical protein
MLRSGSLADSVVLDTSIDRVSRLIIIPGQWVHRHVCSG